jgi:chromosomal replication initiation ATPase DnaA
MLNNFHLAIKIKGSLYKYGTAGSFSTLFTTTKSGDVDNELLIESIRKKIKSDLYHWRKIMTEETQKNPYLLLQRRQIDAIVNFVPKDLKSLSEVPSIGPKTMVYGPKIIELITKRVSAYPDIAFNPIKEEDVEKKVLVPKGSMSSINIQSVLTCKVTFDELTKEQQVVAKNVIDQKNNVFITGSAGTGKSYLLRYIIQELRLKHGFAQVAVTAPTGIASVNIGGSTIHSFAGLGIGTLRNQIIVFHDYHNINEYTCTY